MTKYHIAILFILLSSISCRKPVPQDMVDYDYNAIQSSEPPNVFTAGESIVIKAMTDQNAPPMKLWNAIGATLIEGIFDGTTTQYPIPSPYNSISGALHWRLGDMHGVIDVLPADKLSSLECYIGPTTAIAGERKSYMVVGVTTDIYDNIVKDDTEVIAHHYRDGTLSMTPLRSRSGIIHRLYDSGTTVGNASMSLSQESVTTQEYKVAIGPNVARPFSIRSIVEHNKADGNSLLTLTTDLISDLYGNAIADGTLLNWSIRGTKSQSEIQSYSIGGRSVVEITHPTQAETWKITASIGEAYSNTISQQFESGIQSFQITAEEKLVKIGPMVSFLGQYIPDGFPVQLRVSTANQIVLDWTSLQSKNGYADYDLSPIVSGSIDTDDQYLIEVRSGDISKSLQMNIYE